MNDAWNTTAHRITPDYELPCPRCGAIDPVRIDVEEGRPFLLLLLGAISGFAMGVVITLAVLKIRSLGG
jgi:hypothetical protein